MFIISAITQREMMAIETDKQIQQVVEDYIHDIYRVGERVYLWESCDGDPEDEFKIAGQITLYPPDDIDYSWSEITNLEIQNSRIIDRYEDVQEYLVEVDIETTEIFGNSSSEDPSEEEQESFSQIVHVVWSFEKGKFIVESAEEQ